MSESRELLRLRAIFEGLTVLVVDDDVACRDAFTYILEELGATVLVAADGIEALAVLREHDPDLVVSDITMPRLDGYALVRQVREDPARSGLPMITVSASFPDRQSAGQPGVDGTLSKPFDYCDLDRALYHVMRKRPALFQRQLARLRQHATAWCAKARDLRATAQHLLKRRRTARRHASGKGREAA